MSNLQVVVLKDLHEGISQVWDLHSLLYAMDEQNGINVGSDIIEETSDESWRTEIKVNESQTGGERHRVRRRSGSIRGLSIE